MEKAIFVTRKAALSHALEHAMGHGVPEGEIIQRVKAVPVVRRGEMQGYYGLYPASLYANEYVKEVA